MKPRPRLCSRDQRGLPRGIDGLPERAAVVHPPEEGPPNASEEAFRAPDASFRTPNDSSGPKKDARESSEDAPTDVTDSGLRFRKGGQRGPVPRRRHLNLGRPRLMFESQDRMSETWNSMFETFDTVSEPFRTVSIALNPSPKQIDTGPMNLNTRPMHLNTRSTPRGPKVRKQGQWVGCGLRPSPKNRPGPFLSPLPHDAAPTMPRRRSRPAMTANFLAVPPPAVSRGYLELLTWNFAAVGCAA